MIKPLAIVLGAVLIGMGLVSSTAYAQYAQGYYAPPYEAYYQDYYYGQGYYQGYYEGFYESYYQVYYK